jgi:hypothetical protein
MRLDQRNRLDVLMPLVWMTRKSASIAATFSRKVLFIVLRIVLSKISLTICVAKIRDLQSLTPPRFRLGLEKDKGKLAKLPAFGRFDQNLASQLVD